MASKQLYRVAFLHHGKVYELYCEGVTSDDVVGHEWIGKYIGGNIQWIVLGGTLLLSPWVNRWLR